MTNEDSRNLDLLSMFHYVVGGITALFSCMPFIHVFIGVAMVTGKFVGDGKNSGPPEALFGWLFIIMGALCILLGWSLAVCMVIAGKKLKSRKGITFCMIVAGIECMLIPFGTVLGVFTLIVLNRESVKALFAQAQTPDAFRFSET
ncbi:MAG: hypothetical protein NDI73_05780 [Desulfuromonadales bacterium]|nr:hypothetical protein [Desulfuromonadales bacterium]